jgi:HK97 family phage major capsid protein
MSIGQVTEGVAGDGNLQESTVQAIGKAATKLDQLADELKTAKDTDTARYDAVKTEMKAQADVLQQLKTKHDTEAREAEYAQMREQVTALSQMAAGVREPSKAHLIGGGVNPFAVSAGYEKGSFIGNLYARKDDELSFAERAKAEQTLIDMGVKFDAVPQTSQGSIGSAKAQGGFQIPQMTVQEAYAEFAKATLGPGAASPTTVTLMPNAVVTDLVKPARLQTNVMGLVDTQRVNAYQTTIPVRASRPTRAAVVAWGETKTNVNLTYGGYTATMYTLAIIYDVAKQLLRYTAGAVEQDVLEELGTSFAEGQAYYTLQGSGTNEPYGIQTAIATQFSAFTSSFTASGTTLAGSIATSLATAAGALAVRGRTPEAALLGPLAYWTMLAQGTDTAGFFFSPSGGPTAIRPGQLISPFGIPVAPESQLAGADDLLVGEFSAVDVFLGEAYRVDTSDQAGDRWDKNLVGFRGESEMGLDARAAVASGAFQFIADVLP